MAAHSDAYASAYCQISAIQVTYSVPIIITHGRFRIKVHGPPREHPPPHVHVLIGREGSVKIRLPGEDRRMEVLKHDKIRSRDIRAAFRIVEQHADQLLRAWEDLHG